MNTTSIRANAPIAPSSALVLSNPSTTGLFEYIEGTTGGYFVQNTNGRFGIVAATPQAKIDLELLHGSKAALVEVEGKRATYEDPSTGGTREVIEASKVYRAGVGSADVVGQLENGSSMVFLQSSVGQIPVFAASPAAQAALDRFQSRVDVGDTQMARVVGELEGGAFRATDVELIEMRKQPFPPPRSRPIPAPPGATDAPPVGRPSKVISASIGSFQQLSGVIENRSIMGIGGEAPPSGAYLQLDRPLRIDGALVREVFVNTDAELRDGARAKLSGRLVRHTYGGVETPLSSVIALAVSRGPSKA